MSGFTRKIAHMNVMLQDVRRLLQLCTASKHINVFTMGPPLTARNQVAWSFSPLSVTCASMLESTQGRNLTIAILKDVARPFAIVIISSHTHYPTRVNVHTPARIPPAGVLSPNVTLGNRIWPDTSVPTANTSLRMKQSDVKFLIPSIRMRFASLLSRPSMEFKVTTLVFNWVF